MSTAWPAPRLPTPKVARASLGWPGWLAALAVGVGCTAGSAWVLLGLTSPTLGEGIAELLLWLQVTVQVVAFVAVVSAYATRGSRTSWLRSPLLLLAAGSLSLAVPFLVLTAVVSGSKLS